MLELKVEKKVFVDANGKEIEYKKLYVDTYGVRVYLNAKDKTGEQIIVSYLETTKGAK